MVAKTNVQENLGEGDSLLSSEERAVLSQIADTESPHNQRAQALLAIDEGATQAEAGVQAGLAKGQVRYWLGKYRKDGMSIFPEELLIQARPEHEEEAQQEMPVVEETAEPVDEVAVQREDAPKTKKKGKKKSKETKKSKKRKKQKKDKKKKKGKKSKKKSKKKGSKKAKGAKGNSGKKAGKNALKKGKK